MIRFVRLFPRNLPSFGYPTKRQSFEFPEEKNMKAPNWIQGLKSHFSDFAPGKRTRGRKRGPQRPLLLESLENRRMMTAAMNDARIDALISNATIAKAPAVGLRVPSNHMGQPIVPMVTEDFDQPIPSNDWWSSVHFPAFGDDFSAPLHVHPLVAKATEYGLTIAAPHDTSGFQKRSQGLINIGGGGPSSSSKRIHPLRAISDQKMIGLRFCKGKTKGFKGLQVL